MIKKLQAMKARKGFTLVELIVVVGIIGVLAAILVPIMMGMVTKARIQSANSTAADMQKLINLYMIQAEEDGDHLESSSFVLKITVRSSGSGPAVWSSTAAPSSIKDWKNGTVTWGVGGSYTENTDVNSITNGEALFCAALCSGFSQIRRGSIVIAMKDGKCSFAAFTTTINDTLDDAEFPPLTNGVPPQSFAWNGQAGVSASGYIVGTSPQVALSDG